MPPSQSSSHFAVLTTPRAQPTRLRLAISLALVAAPLAMPATSWTQAVPQQGIAFAIAPSALDTALGQFGVAAKVTPVGRRSSTWASISRRMDWAAWWSISPLKYAASVPLPGTKQTFAIVLAPFTFK